MVNDSSLEGDKIGTDPKNIFHLVNDSSLEGDTVGVDVETCSLLSIMCQGSSSKVYAVIRIA